MTIRSWLTSAAQQLKTTGVSSPALDAEVLLALAHQQTRTWVVTHSDDELAEDIQKHVDSLLARRLNREPMAYIRGWQEFYGRNFIVSPDTLIPRPESETIIELLLQLPETPKTLLDIGTGSGCLAITAKLEQPQTTVSACDISETVLAVAQKNATQLGAEVSFFIADVNKLSNTTRYDAIIANLPYVDDDWQVSLETKFEPQQALYAQQDGLQLINALIEQVSAILTPKGHVLLEADPRQHQAIITKAEEYSLLHITTEGFIVLLQLR